MAKPDWISLNKTSGNGNQTVEVQCSVNTGKQRDGSINIVTTGGITKTVNIFQKRKPIEKYQFRITGTIWVQNRGTFPIEALYVFLELTNTDNENYDEQLLEIGRYDTEIGEANTVGIEFDTDFEVNTHPDQAPFNIVKGIRLSITPDKTNTNIDGVTLGEVIFEYNYLQSIIIEDKEFTNGLLELTDKTIFLPTDDTNININNTQGSPIMIQNVY